MKNHLWYLKRLRKVSLIELPYRINQLKRKKLDKFFTRANDPKLTWEKYPNRFRVYNWRSSSAISPQQENALIAQAQELCNHRFQVFGINADYGERINWHYDPKTKNTWPLSFWGEIDYRDGKTIGGIKFAWEINRLQHLPTLAIAFSLSGNSVFRKEIFDELSSWLEGNPYPYGINWISGIELGIRIVNLVYTLKLLGDKLLVKSEKECVLRFISLHAYHLYRYPSKYSSCANHALAEALGMFMAGNYFRALKGAQKWRETGREILEREVTRQIYPDGSSFEHSVAYLQFVVDHYLIYILACKETNGPYSEALTSRIISAIDFLSHVIDDHGNAPNVGDDDDGFLMKLWVGEHNNYVSLINTCAVLFDRPDWLREWMNFDLKTMLLLGEEAVHSWEKLFQRSKKVKSSACRYFKNAGFAVIRDRGPPNMLFVGNSGPLGLEPLSGHGHADALSFWLSINGRPVFIDPGTYIYHGGGKWRNYFRSTSAHNTVSVDNMNQARMLTEFMFEEFYRIDKASLEENERRVVWSAQHDGFTKLTHAVIHKREVVYKKKKKEFEIRDTLMTKGKHTIQCFYHLHPECKLRSENGKQIIVTEDARIEVIPEKKWIKQRVLQGSTKPMGGWYSSKFNRLQETITLVFETEIECDETLSTRLVLI